MVTKSVGKSILLNFQDIYLVQILLEKVFLNLHCLTKLLEHFPKTFLIQQFRTLMPFD